MIGKNKFTLNPSTMCLLVDKALKSYFIPIVEYKVISVLKNGNVFDVEIEFKKEKNHE